MSVLHPHTIECACGTPLSVRLADSVNGHRSPAIRKSIIDGQLHRCTCHACGRTFTVEKPFYYTDLARNVLFRVAPKGERHGWRQASDELDKAAQLIPDELADREGRVLRTVFGMDELREKLVAQDAGFDDRLIELFKVLLVYEHPFLLKKSRLRLTLADVSDNKLAFSAAFEHSPQKFRINLPRRLADELVAEPQRLQEWTERAHAKNLFDLPDHWVNMWRWSPQPSALDALRSYAAAARKGKEIELRSQAFANMLAALPRGSHLPSWAKQDLRVIFDQVKMRGVQDLQDQLFEIRFGIELEDDWSTNTDKNDIDTLWMLLKDLPDSNVEGNTKIHELLLDQGQGGGLYDPSTNDISIGSSELTNRERFDNVVRHEVGHAVHEMKDQLVTNWLRDEFGWNTFSSADTGIDQWVAQMGGWGDLNAGQRSDVRHSLRSAVGKGSSWKPGKAAVLPASHPWNRAGFGPRIAFEKTGANWFQNYAKWHRFNGKAFFINYWYQTFIVVDEATLALIGDMPDAYAAMSHYEFFAELYALYFDLDAPHRSAIPATAMKWLDANIGHASTSMPRAVPERVKEQWESTARPRL
jgi:hypothetical protein